MNPHQFIYLDYAATTPVDPIVASEMQKYLLKEGCFANPSSMHQAGVEARNAVETSRTIIARAIGASAKEIIFTSGATESCNLALKGVASLYKKRGNHIITMQTEHAAVLNTCSALEKQGFQITYLKPERNGLLNLENFKNAIRKDTLLVSIMHVNNETGVIQPIDQIAEITNAHQIFFHIDAAQSIGKLPINIQKMPIDLMSISAHKFNGPKGIGALFIRQKPRIRLNCQLHGGGQENAQRSGTLPTHQIVGMATALQIAEQNRIIECQRLSQLRKIFIDHLSGLPFVLNSDLENTVPHIINLHFKDINAKKLLMHCSTLGISLGSACHGKDNSPSHVLRAMGCTVDETLASLRISMGRYTTADEMIEAASLLREAISKHHSAIKN